MNAIAEQLTVSQQLILAAEQLESEGLTPFSAEALTVTAWKQSPKTFGLKGFIEQHPDANKVLTCIMGQRGLATRGWFEKRGQKSYSLSRQGKEEAKRIREGGETVAAQPKRRNLAQIKVTKELDNSLTSLFQTTAYRRYEEGMKREITYRDACRFWNLADTAHGEAVDKALDRVPQTLAAVEALLVGGSVELGSGQSVSQVDLNTLASVHQFLQEQFSRHLSQQRDKPRRF